MSEILIDKKYLRENPDHIFVFGDNVMRTGRGGAAYLRGEPNTYGFITKRYPASNDFSYFRVDEYREIFEIEFNKLKEIIENTADKIFLISKIGAGLANKYGIYEEVILPRLPELTNFENVKFLFDLED